MVSAWVILVTKSIEYLTLWSKTSHVRKLRKAVDAGETYIRLSHELAAESNEKMKIHIQKRMNYMEKVFYKLNQG